MPKWITVKEAAALMDVDESLVRRLAKEGRLRARRFGKAWQISEWDASHYVRRRKSDSAKVGDTGA